MSKETITETISFDSVAKDVWDFVKQPKLDHLSEKFKAQPFSIFPYLFLLGFLMMIPLSGISTLTWHLFEIDHKIGNLFDRPWMLAIQAILLAPILEEAIFRLPMKYSYVRMFAACCLVPIILFSFIDSETTIALIAIVFLVIVAFFHFIDQRNDNRLNTQMASLWEANFHIPFWILTASFALLHVSNFDGQFPWYLAPLLVLPQFALGIILGYIRTGYGFVYAVLFHAFHNGVFLIPMLILQSITPST